MREGMACGLMMRSGVMPSAVKGMSSCREGAKVFTTNGQTSIKSRCRRLSAELTTNHAAAVLLANCLDECMAHPSKYHLRHV